MGKNTPATQFSFTPLEAGPPTLSYPSISLVSLLVSARGLHPNYESCALINPIHKMPLAVSAKGASIQMMHHVHLLNLIQKIAPALERGE
jgi:hypothetical protein